MASVCYLIPDAVDTSRSSSAPERLRQIDHSLLKEFSQNFLLKEKGTSRSIKLALPAHSPRDDTGYVYSFHHCAFGIINLMKRKQFCFPQRTQSVFT